MQIQLMKLNSRKKHSVRYDETDNNETNITRAIYVKNGALSGSTPHPILICIITDPDEIDEVVSGADGQHYKLVRK